MRATLFKKLLIILLAFAGSALAFNSCRSKGVTATGNNKAIELWTCSMHPEIIRDKPGTCPICGMDLIKKGGDAAAITDIQLNDLLQPTDRFVVSSIPVTTIKRATQPIEVETLGTIGYDTRLVNTISARVTGRIDKLYVKYRYQHIMKGERIMDIYSPELLTTQNEFLFLIKNDPQNSSMIDAGKQKLLLLGMSEAQLQQIIKTEKPSLTVAVYAGYSGHIHEAGPGMPGMTTEQKMDISRVTEELPVKTGMYVGKGQTIFQLFNVDRSWVVLNVFPEYQGVIKKGNAVRVIPETAPTKSFRAQIDFIEPFYRKENKTLSARVYFNNSRSQIPVGSQVRATVFSKGQEADWLPREAVISLGIDKVVFIKTKGGFKAHQIQTGLSYKNRIQIVSGINETDSVATNAQFLTDSESFIKVKKQP